MALKGVIQGPGGTGGGQLSGSGVTSVALSGPAPFITGPPVTSAGTLTFDFSGVPIPVADGGTGMGSFAANSLITAGLGSSGPFQSKPFPGTSSTFLDGTGAFSVPAGGGGGGGTGTVTSVDLSPPPEFAVSGNPITTAGTLVLGRIAPTGVSAGGTGGGSFTSNALVQAGLSSTGAFRSLPLNQQTSTYLDGTGTFRSIPYPPAGAGTVTSVALTASGEFLIQGSPITTSGTFNIARATPDAVSSGGTGLGSFLANSILQAGPSSTAPFTSVPLNNLTSNFLRGDGVFAAPPPPPAGGTGTVTSVDLALSSEFTVSGNPITTLGQLVVGWRGPLAVAHGGTGMGSFGPGVVIGGLNSNAPLQGLPFTNLTSQFLAGDGTFRIPLNPGGTVQSVALTMTSEFSITGSPILGSGTIDLGFKQPLAVAHGGTGLGSTGVGAILRGGLTSTAPFQGLPLTNLTSNFLRGDGVFGVPPSNPGTVTMVGLTLTSEFNIVPNPVLGSGALAASFAFQNANFFFGGPATGNPTTPAFRLLVNADVPQTLSGKTLTSSVFQNPTVTAQTLTFGSSIKWNMNSGPIALLGMDSTVVGLMDTPANLPNAGSAVLRIMQLGTGLPTLGFNAIFKFEGGVKPTLSSGFTQVDVITLYLESTALYGATRKAFR